MRTLVLYESQFGNTKRVAETIGMQLLAEGPVRVTTIDAFKPQFLDGVDLFVLGGPTQAHGLSPAMREFLRNLQAPEGRTRAATFDTRIKGPVFLWGSAAPRIESSLKNAGFDVMVPAASFLVTLAREPELHEGEEQRAAGWACRLADEVQAELLLAV